MTPPMNGTQLRATQATPKITPANSYSHLSLISHLAVILYRITIMLLVLTKHACSLEDPKHPLNIPRARVDALRLHLICKVEAPKEYLFLSSVTSSQG